MTIEEKIQLLKSEKRRIQLSPKPQTLVTYVMNDNNEKQLVESNKSSYLNDDDFEENCRKINLVSNASDSEIQTQS